MQIAPSRRRLTALVSLLLHLFLAGAVPLAAARHEVEVQVAAHLLLESQDDPADAPRHDHTSCQLCRTLDHRLVPLADSPAFRFVTAASYPPLPRVDQVPPRTTPFSSVRSRAPPLA